MSDQDLKRRVAEVARDACLKAALEAYENAGISGLCEEGRWECAVAAIRSLDLEAVINKPSDNHRK
jgi:hypothetical protein